MFCFQISLRGVPYCVALMGNEYNLSSKAAEVTATFLAAAKLDRADRGLDEAWVDRMTQERPLDVAAVGATLHCILF